MIICKNNSFIQSLDEGNSKISCPIERKLDYINKKVFTEDYSD